METLHAQWFIERVRQAVVLLLDGILPEGKTRPRLDEIVLSWDRLKPVGIQYQWSWNEYVGLFWQWDDVHTNDDALVFLNDPYPCAESLRGIARKYATYQRRQRRRAS